MTYDLSAVFLELLVCMISGGLLLFRVETDSAWRRLYAVLCVLFAGVAVSEFILPFNMLFHLRATALVITVTWGAHLTGGKTLRVLAYATAALFALSIVGQLVSAYLGL